MMRRQHQDQQSRVFNDLSVLVLNLLRSSSAPMQFDDELPPEVSSSRWSPEAQITPAGFASLMLGVSLAMMLCGSVTFFIGFMLMPWVFGLVMVFYVAGVVSSLSVLGRSVFCYATGPSTTGEAIPAWKLL